MRLDGIRTTILLAVLRAGPGADAAAQGWMITPYAGAGMGRRLAVILAGLGDAVALLVVGRLGAADGAHGNNRGQGRGNQDFVRHD